MVRLCLVKDFGDGVVPTNHMFQQMAPGVIDEVDLGLSPISYISRVMKN